LTITALSECIGRLCAEGAAEQRNANARSRISDGDMAVEHVVTVFKQALRRLGIADYVIRRSLRFVHAPHAQCATTDLDVMVVTPFGAFVVCVMSLQGNVEPGPNTETLIAACGEGEPMLHTSPVRRHAAVLRSLRSLLSVYECPVEGLAIAAATPCQIHPLLPESILAPDELYHYLRLRLLRFFDIGRPHVVVLHVVDAIDRRSENRVSINVGAASRGSRERDV